MKSIIKKKCVTVSMTQIEIKMLEDFRDFLQIENPSMNFSDAVNHCIWNYLRNNKKFNGFVLNKEKEGEGV